MVFLIILLAVLLLFLFLICPSLRRHPERKNAEGMFIAHRGLHSVFENTPENSMAAFDRAIELGFAIEMDVHITSDDKLIVFHDDDLERMCSVSGKPEDKTLEELTALRLAGTEYTIPSFEDFLKRVDGRVPILIELKTKSPKTCKRLCRAVDTALKNYKGKYYIQSFYPPALLWYRRHRKDVFRGQLSSGKFEDKRFHMKLLSALLLNFISRPDFVSYEIYYDNNFFRRVCEILGAYSFGWTFKSSEELEKYKNVFPARIFEGFIPEK